MLVRVQKSARRLELSAPGWNLAFDAERPWTASLSAGTGRAVADLFLGSSVDTSVGRDELSAPGAPALTREEDRLIVTCATSSSRWATKRYVFVCTEADIEYRVEVEGKGCVTTCRLFQGFLARDIERLGLGPSYFRAGFERPYRDLARGSRASFEAILTTRPTAAERDLLALWEDSEIDLVDDPFRHGGLDSFLPAPWLFGLDLGADQPWVSVGLAPSSEELAFRSFAFRGGESVGWELALPGVPVDGAWRSPALVFTFGARDPEHLLRGHADALRRRGLLGDEGLAGPAWWRRPIFDGQGEQQALRGASSAYDECTLANYLDALAVLRGHDLRPGTVLIGPGWMGSQPGEPDATRWPDLAGFIERQHQEGRRVVLAWPLALRPPAHLALDPYEVGYRAWLDEVVGQTVSPEHLGADGLWVTSGDWPDGRWLYTALSLVRNAAKAARPDALLAAPTVNSAYADLVDLVPLGSLWTDRASVLSAVRHRALIARSASNRWLLGVSDRHAPGRAAWRAVIEAQAALGVPMLSYARHLDQTGEPLEIEDFALVRRVWAEASAG